MKWENPAVQSQHTARPGWCSGLDSILFQRLLLLLQTGPRRKLGPVKSIFLWLLLLVHQAKEWLKRHRSAHWHDREQKHTRKFCSLRKKNPEQTSMQGWETAFCSHVLWLIVINSHVLSDMLLLTESDGFPSAAPPLAIHQTGKGGWERIDFVAVKMLGCRFSVC